MKYWKYKAYTAAGGLVDGVRAGVDPYHVMLEIRQSLLVQVYELTSITLTQYREYGVGNTKIVRLRRRAAAIASNLTGSKTGSNTGQDKAGATGCQVVGRQVVGGRVSDHSLFRIVVVAIIVLVGLAVALM